jgi:hypothetical protein
MLALKMNKHAKQAVVTAAVTFALGSCIAFSAGQGDDPEADSDGQIPGNHRTETMVQMSLSSQLDFSRRDLSSRLDIDPDDVEVSISRPVTWRSGALGCPRPGVAYTDALVSGILIELRVGKATYRYHARRGGQPFYCPDDRAESPAPGAGLD